VTGRKKQADPDKDGNRLPAKHSLFVFPAQHVSCLSGFHTNSPRFFNCRHDYWRLWFTINLIRLLPQSTRRIAEEKQTISSKEDITLLVLDILFVTACYFGFPLRPLRLNCRF
jgi:hypothetical protein